MTPREHDRVKLSDRVLASRRTFDGTYGSPRITADLRAKGIFLTQKTVAKVINELGIAGISTRFFVVETTITESQPAYPRDRVKRAFWPTRVNMIWASDITYVHSLDGVAYECAICGEYSGRIVGWAVADHMRDELVIMTLKMAYVTRARKTRGIVFHTDRCSQFISRTVRKQCRLLGLKRSMGKTRSYFDHATAESY
jgi:putative transposase